MIQVYIFTSDFFISMPEDSVAIGEYDVEGGQEGLQLAGGQFGELAARSGGRHSD